MWDNNYSRVSLKKLWSCIHTVLYEKKKATDVLISDTSIDHLVTVLLERIVFAYVPSKES